MEATWSVDRMVKDAELDFAQRCAVDRNEGLTAASGAIHRHVSAATDELTGEIPLAAAAQHGQWRLLESVPTPMDDLD